MRRLGIAVLLGMVTLGLAADAGACMRKMKRKPTQVDPTLAAVKKAEKALARGDAESAVTHARVAFAQIHQLPPSGAAELPIRAQRAAALATVRADGAVDLGPGLAGDTEQGRRTNLAWASLVLTYQSALQPDNLLVKTQLAEALAADPYQSARAREILADLADRDVMPSAHAYVVLAKLEAARGDDTARKSAIDRCVEFGGKDACKA